MTYREKIREIMASMGFDEAASTSFEKYMEDKDGIAAMFLDKEYQKSERYDLETKMRETMAKRKKHERNN